LYVHFGTCSFINDYVVCRRVSQGTENNENSSASAASSPGDSALRGLKKIHDTVGLGMGWNIIKDKLKLQKEEEKVTSSEEDDE
jgi:hypothetical protein